MTADTENSMDIDNRYSGVVGAEAAVEVEVEVDEAKKAQASSTTTNSNNSATQDSAVVYSPQLLQMYYSRLFPFTMLHSWLSYGSQQIFSKREFSFTIEPTAGEEIYIRYQSFAGEKELAQAILKRRPTKIDIGAVFSHAPKDHNSIQKSNFVPAQRELVFDIDLTDYDEIRRCGCSGAKICPTCWGFMKMAVKVMDAGLRQDFGFQHIGWFYSGRRGVHAWVCDDTARQLTDQGRSAVANYFEVNLGTDKNKDVQLPHPLHPMLARAFDVLEPMFIEQVLPSSGHGLLATEDQWQKLLQSLPDAAEPVRNKMNSIWGSSKNTSSPPEKWAELNMHLKAFVKGSSNNKSSSGHTSKSAKHMSSKDRSRIDNWPAEVVFRYTYPRLDVNVSKMRNHLLKSPFCVHPKTGRVCVPFLAGEVDDFDPFTVPTLSRLMKELDEYKQSDDDKDGDGTSDRLVPDWKKTSLKGYFEPFQKHFLAPLTKKLRRQDRDAAEQQAAMAGEF